MPAIRSVEEIERAVASARTMLVFLDADRLSPQDCARLLGDVSALAKVCLAAQARLATRAAAAQMHRRDGYSDAGEWLAGMAGTTTP